MAKFALITGASGGLGRALALRFAKGGYHLILVARRREVMEEVRAEVMGRYGRRVWVIEQDLAVEDAPERVAKILQKAKIPVDVLVNNAGFGDNRPFLESDWEKQADMVRVNILALAHMSRVFGAQMRERGTGHILNVASIAAFFPGPFMATYYASKAFVLSLTRALAVELRGSGVKVTALCLGPADTGFDEVADVARGSLFYKVPMLTPDRVAEVAYRDCLRGRVVSCVGLLTKFGRVAAHIVPAGLAARAVSVIHRRQ